MRATSYQVGPDLGTLAAVTDGELLPHSPALNGRAIRVPPSEGPTWAFCSPASCCYQMGGGARAELSAAQPVPQGR
jgi:hypothetical protein